MVYPPRVSYRDAFISGRGYRLLYLGNHASGSGLFWVPLDVCNHHQRLAAIVSESRPVVLICHHATEDQAQVLTPGGARILNIEDVSVCNDTTVANVSTPLLIAASLCISGSIGSPYRNYV